MTDIRFNFDGLEEGLKRMQRTVRVDAMERVVSDAAEPMENDMKGGSQAWSSGVSRSVRTRVVERHPRQITVATGSRHPLAHIFEFGTKLRKTSAGWIRGRIRKQPALRPAFDGNVRKWFDLVGKGLWKEIRRAGR